MKFTTEQAAQSVLATKDQLIAIRTRLTDAAENDDMSGVRVLLPDIDALLKTLGVAEGALKRQVANPLLQHQDWGQGFDVYEEIPTPTPEKK